MKTIDPGTFGGNKIDHILVDILNKRNNQKFTSRILAIINGYNRDISETEYSFLVTRLKLKLLQFLLEDRRKWLKKYLADDPIKTYLDNCMTCKKRMAEKRIKEEIV